MRRALVVTTSVLALGLAFAGGAQAKCSVTCLNHRVTQLSSALIKTEKTVASLSKTVAQQNQTIATQGQTISAQGAAIAGMTPVAKFVKSLEECLFEAPLTQYGENEGSFGYVFDTGTESIDTSALDITEEGSSISAWFIFDACNPQETLALSGGGAGVFPRAAGSSGLFAGGVGR